MYKLSCILVAALALLASCSGGSALTASELQAWIADPAHGLVQVDRQKGTVATVYYRPAALIVAQEVNGMAYTAAQRDSVAAQYDSLHYFVLKLEQQGQSLENFLANDAARYTDAVSYFNGGLAADMTLHVGATRHHPEYVTYVKGFGATSGSAVVMVFYRALLDTPADLELVWHDTRLQTGLHRFLFRRQDLTSIPVLTY